MGTQADAVQYAQHASVQGGDGAEVFEQVLDEEARRHSGHPAILPAVEHGLDHGGGAGRLTGWALPHGERGK
ncbi:hypothetical protein GCM10023166_29360 [Paeniglutamicibacter cryotolerans]